jgi:hypothetical protein
MTDLQEDPRGFIYVASPYTHSNEAVRELRYQNVMAYTAWLLKQERWAYSPIVHHHVMAARFALPHDFDYWMRLDFTMIDASSELHVLKIPGWQESKGVNAEIQYWLRTRERSLITFADMPTHV